MSLMEINWKPGRRELRQFALVWLVGFGVAGAVLAWRSGHVAVPALVVWAAAVLVGTLGLLVPGAVRPIYMAWMAAAFPIGWVVSHVLLAVVFYVVFGACALVFRLMGRDALQRRFDPAARSYWIERPKPSEPGRYFKQF